MLSTHGSCDVLWGGWSHRVEHYIMERRYWRFVFENSNYHYRTVVKNIAGVTPRGVVYTLRSVLRGLTMSSLAHFTVYLYTSTWVFLCLFTTEAVVGPNSEQADASTHVFSFVVNRKWYLFVWVKADNYKRKNNRQRNNLEILTSLMRLKKQN